MSDIIMIKSFERKKFSIVIFTLFFGACSFDDPFKNRHDPPSRGSQRGKPITASETVIDNTHSNPENVRLELINPEANSLLSGDIPFQVSVTNLPEKATIEYLLNGRTISGALAVNEKDLSHSFVFKSEYDAEDGLYRIEAVAKDPFGKILARSETRQFNIANKVSQAIQIITPNTNPWSGVVDIQFSAPTKETVLMNGQTSLGPASTDFFVDGEKVGTNDPYQNPDVIVGTPLKFALDTRLFRDGKHRISVKVRGKDYCNCGEYQTLGIAHFSAIFSNPKSYVDLDPRWNDLHLEVGQTFRIDAVDAVFADGLRIEIPSSGKTLFTEEFLGTTKSNWTFKDSSKVNWGGGSLILEGNNLSGPNLAWVNSIDSDDRLLPLVNLLEVSQTVENGFSYSDILRRYGGLVFGAKSEYSSDFYTTGWQDYDSENRGFLMVHMRPSITPLPVYATSYQPGSDSLGGLQFRQKIWFSRRAQQVDTAVPIHGKFWMDGTAEPEGWQRFRKENSQGYFDGWRPPNHTTTYVFGLIASGRTTFRNLSASAKPRFFSSDRSIVRISENGQIEALNRGAALITVELGNKARTIRVTVDTATDIPHLSRHGTILTSYNPLQSIIPRTLFNFNIDVANAFKRSRYDGLIRAAGINAVHSGIPISVDYYPDTINGGLQFCSDVSNLFTSIKANLTNLNLYAWLAGDGLLWGDTILNRTWSSTGLQCVMSAMKSSERVTHITLVDECQGSWTDGTNPKYHGIPNSFRASTNGHVPWGWHPFFANTGSNMATWFSNGNAEIAGPEWYYFSSFSDGNNFELKTSMDDLHSKSVDIANQYQGPTLPKETMIPVLADWNYTLTQGEPYHQHEGILNDKVWGIPAIMWNAITQGIVALRMYALGPGSVNYYEKSAAGSKDQAAINPLTWRTHGWQAMASASTLIGLLEGDILRRPINAVSVGRGGGIKSSPLVPREDIATEVPGSWPNTTVIHTAARQGPESRVLITVNLSGDDETGSINTAPYRYEQGKIIQYRQFGAAVMSQHLSSPAIDKPNMRSGEIIIYKFVPSEAQLPPAVRITSPIPDSVHTGTIAVNIEVDEVAPLKSIQYMIDDTTFFEDNGGGRSASLNVNTLQPEQWHSLRVVVVDVNGRINESRIAIKPVQPEIIGQWIVDEQDSGYAEHVNNTLLNPFADGPLNWIQFHSYRNRFRTLSFNADVSENNYAEWTQTNLPSTNFRIYTTWGELAPQVRTEDAKYEIFDGNLSLGVIRKNQDMLGWVKTWDPTNKSQGWEPLGTFAIKSGTLRVRLYQPHQHPNIVMADAIMIRTEKNVAP